MGIVSYNILINYIFYYFVNIYTYVQKHLDSQ